MEEKEPGRQFMSYGKLFCDLWDQFQIDSHNKINLLYDLSQTTMKLLLQT